MMHLFANVWILVKSSLHQTLTSDAYRRLPKTADMNTCPCTFRGKPELISGFRSLDHTLAAALIRMVVSMRAPPSVSIHAPSILT